MASPSNERFRRVEAKNSNSSSVVHQFSTSKKPFNRRQWRKNHYKAKFGNANEGHYLDNKRKIVKEYRKMLHNEREKGVLNSRTVSYDDDEDEVDDNGNVIPIINNKIKKKKLTVFTKAKLEHEKKVNEKQKKKEEYARVRKEKEEAIKRYKEKKFARYRKMSKKTRKGQPVMKERMELLLETLEKQIEADRKKPS